ncbi:50S ribosomal protein L33 [Listeria grandensis FSL F6-0971]|nr:50S ribosomal protein L33 [Listeria grandensis FSL F6-0971]EUJ47088.1 50S ribosomal protein L33 [Listeria riparia FSL S10-1204]
MIMKKKTSLACSECGSRNYSVGVGGTARTERLEVKKFCRHCNKHTLHRETK